MPRSFWKLSCFLLLICCFSVRIFADDDPNPDSPTPVLLSQPGSTQVLAVDDANWNGNIPKTTTLIFRPGLRNGIRLFVTNLDLMETEGVNALRVYIYQKSGKTFELQTAGLTKVNKTVYALKALLYDRDGFRGQPQADDYPSDHRRPSPAVVAVPGAPPPPAPRA